MKNGLIKFLKKKAQKKSEVEKSGELSGTREERERSRQETLRKDREVNTNTSAHSLVKLWL